ncbi:hypothetical protein EVA_18015, partial [gut metagenome]
MTLPSKARLFKLLKDVSENVKIAEGKDITLELNGFTIDGRH